MVASRKDENLASKRPPATTPQGRENQVISLAYDVAEKQLLSGNASSQVITHFLKLGTERERLERLKLEQETLLAQARVENLAAAGRIEVLYDKAMNAFKGYQPSSEDDLE
jgi:hypothetical protein